VAVIGCISLPTQLPAQPPGKDTPAADRTRTKLLKVKVTVSFEHVPLRDVLKEFAAQVAVREERPVMWTYAPGFPADTRVTYACSDKPLDQALDELFKLHGLGYVVIANENDRRDGWVGVGRGNDRGLETNVPPTDDDDQRKAAGRLALAKDLIDKGKPADAKAVLLLVTNKYPMTKAAIEAKALLEKLEK
jgi:hypothetical protein